MTADQILTVEQMRQAEQALIDAGSSVDALMQIAGRGAADWVWRMAGNGRVTVLCGPGNNGGDGYVIAEAIRERGGEAVVVAASEPNTDAARDARAAFGGEVLGTDASLHGEVFVDCLFGSGLTRPLTEDHLSLLGRLASRHRHRVAVDLPSGVQSDSGMLLNDGLPNFDLTIALGAWKFAHVLMPAAAIWASFVWWRSAWARSKGAARMIARPRIAAPFPAAHKYTRGLARGGGRNHARRGAAGLRGGAGGWGGLCQAVCRGAPGQRPVRSGGRYGRARRCAD